MAGRLSRQIEAWFPERSSWISLALSMVLAVFLWGYTVSEAKFVKDIYIPLELINIPPGMVVLGEDAAQSLTIQIQAPPDLLKRVREEDVDVKVDLSQMEAGPQIVNIRSDHVRLPSSVELVGVKPSTLHFRLDAVATVSIPVEPTFEDEAPESLVVRSWKVSPEKADVTGPESMLEEIESLGTEPVSLSTRTASFEEPIVPVAPMPEVSITPGQAWTLAVALGERRRQRTITGVTISTTNGEALVRVNPETLKINVSGPESLINRLRPQDFKAEVDAARLDPSPTPYQIKPAVRFLGRDPARELTITTVIPHYVAVTVEELETPVE